jgi:hypothetical protein
MNTIIFLLICYGACNNLIFGSIFEGFRTYLAKFGTSGYSLHKLFTCFMCLGTWMGFIISGLFIAFGIPTPLLIACTPVSIFLHGLLSAAGVWLIHTLQEKLER